MTTVADSVGRFDLSILEGLRKLVACGLFCLSPSSRFREWEAAFSRVVCCYVVVNGPRFRARGLLFFTLKDP